MMSYDKTCLSDSGNDLTSSRIQSDGNNPEGWSCRLVQASGSVDQCQCFVLLLCLWLDSPAFVSLCQIPRKSSGLLNLACSLALPRCAHSSQNCPPLVHGSMIATMVFHLSVVMSFCQYCYGFQRSLHY